MEHFDGYDLSNHETWRATQTDHGKITQPEKWNHFRAAATYPMIIMIRWAIPKSQDFGSIEHPDSLGQTVFR